MCVSRQGCVRVCVCVCVLTYSTKRSCVRACGCVRLDVIDQEMRAAGVRAFVYV